MDSSLDTTHSSEIHSQLLSSHIEDTATVSSMSDIEEDHLETTTRIGQLFINGSPPISRKLLQNLEFYEANVVNAKLPFEDNHFDFVQQRLVTSSFTISDWKCAIQELVRVTKPGGYIQLLEIDHYTFNLGPLGKLWEAELINTIREKRKMEPRMACHLPDLLKAMGMADVSSKLVSIPFGSWGLDLGVLWKNNIESFAESTAPLFSKLVGCTPAEYRQKWRTLIEEAKDRKAFSNIHAAWARKPADYKQDAIDWSLCPPFCTDIK
ncbi:hypothetical protein CU098_006693 [Rhizopus stolonifer]|uniref:Methyltransferase type 11 domain-containing protein n=1 Tax=Rhizopus stolonifer TaxID=4846 RepID=A0A367IS76_RHIST|nr:hypothetical protein CU098_006693 [Rhizopus stolonifer]